jgi:putative transposase
MKKGQFSETQIIKAIQSNAAGRSVEEVCRELGVSSTTFYKWRQRYGGMDVKELTRFKQLEYDNAQLKRMYADLSMKYEAINDVLQKKF